MGYQLYFMGTNIQVFLHRLKQLNKYLKYFPISETTTLVMPLRDDDIIPEECQDWELSYWACSQEEHEEEGEWR